MGSREPFASSEPKYQRMSDGFDLPGNGSELYVVSVTRTLSFWARNGGAVPLFARK